MKTGYVETTDKEETRNRVRKERRNINNGDRYRFTAKKGAGSRWKAMVQCERHRAEVMWKC
jgi:hypothetical protein